MLNGCISIRGKCGKISEGKTKRRFAVSVRERKFAFKLLGVKMDATFINGFCI